MCGGHQSRGEEEAGSQCIDQRPGTEPEVLAASATRPVSPSVGIDLSAASGYYQLSHRLLLSKYQPLFLS